MDCTTAELESRKTNHVALNHKIFTISPFNKTTFLVLIPEVCVNEDSEVIFHLHDYHHVPWLRKGGHCPHIAARRLSLIDETDTFNCCALSLWINGSSDFF